MIYIGIDPGASGGYCILSNSDPVRMQGYNKETPRGITIEIKGFATTHCFAILERVSAMPGQGVSSTFKFGQNFGWWQGVLDSIQIPYKLVTPYSWQKGLGIKKKQKNESQTDFKRRLKHEAEKLYPNLKITNATADAMLIAHYAKSNF